MRKWLVRANSTAAVDSLTTITTTSKSNVDVDNARTAGKRAEKILLQNDRM